MKIERKKMKKIKDILWTSFRPEQEHIGFDKAITIHQLRDDILKKVSITNGHRKTCPYFLELFTDYLGNIIHITILNPKSKKWYVMGLLCEPVKESNKPNRRRIGHYYFPKDKEEYDRIKRLAKAQLTASEIKYDLRILQGGKEHLKQLSYMKDKPKSLT